MESVERVTVRLSSQTVALLKTLVDDGEYQNLSDVVRDAIDSFISARFTPENIAKITVDLPKKRATELEELVKDGDAVSMEDAIRNAVVEYVRSRVHPEDKN
ncbi:MAG: ribbon-helix-helix domain-containing protein [Candidatus Methanomethylophilaceae archaeon]